MGFDSFHVLALVVAECVNADVTRTTNTAVHPWVKVEGEMMTKAALKRVGFLTSYTLIPELGYVRDLMSAR